MIKDGTPIMALMSSANLDSRERVKRQLMLDNALLLMESVTRQNVRLGVRHIPDSSLDCLDWIVKEVKEKGLSLSPILIYCRSLNDVSRVFYFLKAELE